MTELAAIVEDRDGSAVRSIRDGLPVTAIDRLIADGIVDAGEVDRLIIPRRTLQHRRHLGRLTPEQSDRVVRIARIVALAVECFGSEAKARVWLRRPSRLLENEAPLDRLDTEAGARAVEVLLGRIAHGIAA
ncbi:DUF2384 domain-containing protein [Oleomonas cavernae]|uniref:DUF2384 domain-containing protein n=1 Tax=Oleomonas cavernae TaxID=2320859 RepID=A0A418WG98_9PROT|nr:antitoxin Xre/MbcA/ParS toxin-binding domain-containing protein [Oleomonas cavernae]RJF89056.1 DUF2384 domain-containing protein [Oleomonas cavernae]